MRRLARLKRSPWWFCTGWWSPWCVADAIAHCRVPWICRKHDRAQVRWFDATSAEGEPVDLIGTPEVVVASEWPVYTSSSTSTASKATVTFTETGANWNWS